MIRSTPREALLVVMLLAATLTPHLPVSSAGHATTTLPMLVGTTDVDGMLATLEEGVSSGGCYNWSGACSGHLTKWVTIAVAHAGVDPGTWPTAEGSLVSALLSDGALLDDGAPTSNRAQRLATAILAVAAAGLDPRALEAAGDARDLVEDLLNEFTGIQFGDAELVNDDVWAVIALNAAGYDGDEVDRAIVLIEAAQHASGGVGYSMGAPSVDTTAEAIMALAPHGRDGFVGKALGYLRDAQFKSGTARGCWPSMPSQESSANVDATARVLPALVAAGEDPAAWRVDGQGAADCLASAWRSDGARWNLLRRYNVLSALGWAPFGSVRGPVTPLHYFSDARAGSPATLDVPNGFLRVGATTHDPLRVTPGEEGTLTYHGFAFGDPPRPVTYTLNVSVGLPRAPAVETPTSIPHGAAFTVRLTPADSWTDVLRLRHPDGSVREGATHAVRIAMPGTHELGAWGVNRLGEDGPMRRITVVATNAAPVLDLVAPAEAPRSRNLTLDAAATDPEGDAVTLAWTIDGADAGSGPSATLRPKAPNATTNVTVRAVDAWGAETERDVTVRWVDSPPTVHVKGPAAAPPGRVRLEANATDADGDDVSLSWSIGGERVANGSVAHLALGPGTHVVEVEARTPYAVARANHTVVVEPDALTVRLEWDGSTLLVHADATTLRVGDAEGSPPLRVEDVRPGSELHVEAVEGGTVVAVGRAAVPEAPPTPAPETPEEEAPDDEPEDATSALDDGEVTPAAENVDEREDPPPGEPPQEAPDDPTEPSEPRRKGDVPPRVDPVPAEAAASVALPALGALAALGATALARRPRR